jgi:hypothetical protein
VSGTLGPYQSQGKRKMIRMRYYIDVINLGSTLETAGELLNIQIHVIIFVLFLTILGFELRASHLLDRFLTTSAISPALFCVEYF